MACGTGSPAATRARETTGYEHLDRISSTTTSIRIVFSLPLPAREGSPQAIMLPEHARGHARVAGQSQLSCEQVMML